VVGLRLESNLVIISGSSNSIVIVIVMDANLVTVISDIRMTSHVFSKW